MKTPRKILFLLSLVGLAATAAVAVARVGEPSIASVLVLVAAGGVLAGAPGLLHRRAWPVALVLMPLGAYLVARLLSPVPPSVHGLSGQWGFYVDQLRAGSHAYATEALPFDLAAWVELKLLLSLVVYAGAALAAVFALSLRKPLPAIAILLALLGFGLTIDESERVAWLPLAFLLLTGCLLVLSRSLERRSWKPGDAVAGATTAIIAALLALTLLGTTPVAAGKPWQDWRSWDPAGADHSTLIVFDWMENFPRLLDPQDNAEVMRVTSPVASYWRANALDSFTGSAWFGTKSPGDYLAPQGSEGSSTYAIPVAYPEPRGRLVSAAFDTTSLATDYLFTTGVPRGLVLDRPRSVTLTRDAALWTGSRLGPGCQYTITAVVPQLAPADLVGRGRDYPRDLVTDVLLPFPAASEMKGVAPEREWRDLMARADVAREWQGLYGLNRDVVGAVTDPYQIALRVEEYLRFNFAYSLTPPATDFRSPYAAFLFDTKEGYCQHFAGAMAVLLRFNGIPARVAVGFAEGSRVTHYTFLVTRNDAHAWVEAYFPGAGWVAFDPTPGHSLPGAGTSSTSAGFVDPFASDRAEGGGALTRPTAAPRGLQQDPGTGQDFGAASPAPAARALGWLVAAGALAATVVAWPVARLSLRRRRLRRGSLERRLRVSLALLYADLRDYGVGIPVSRTLEETAGLIRESLDVDATPLVDRVQAVLFGGRAATPQDLTDVARLRRELKRRLRARRGWRRTLAALYGLSTARG